MTNTATEIQPQTSSNISTWNIDPAHTVAEWNAALETGGILVGHDVTITLEAEFVKA